MEENVTSFNESLQQLFALPTRDWKQYSPLTLAYIGDAAYDLVIRTILVKEQDLQTDKLHRKAVSLVSAKAQAKMLPALLPLLTKEEKEICRRGRNTKPPTKAKNATRAEYQVATAFEALMGYLYLEEEFERMDLLIQKGLSALQETKKNGNEKKT